MIDYYYYVEVYVLLDKTFSLFFKISPKLRRLIDLPFYGKLLVRKGLYMTKNVKN